MVTIEEVPDTESTADGPSALQSEQTARTDPSDRSNGDTDARPKMHVMLVVLGDLGRSPRMQYHALSLLQAGHYVTLVGYKGEPLIPDLESERQSPANTQLAVVRFSVPSPKLLQKSLPVYLLWRVASLTLWLVHAMFVSTARGIHAKRTVDCVLVQNPPAMPLLFIAYLYCLLQGLLRSKRPGFVIDWHNLGFSMIKSSNPLISAVARSYEQFMAPLANGHLTVTKAMKTWLAKNFRLNPNSISVLHDCPPELFRPTDTNEQHELLLRLHPQLTGTCPRSWTQHLVEGSQTLFTDTLSTGNAVPRRGRPALLTSSTSWTADEDFGVLLDALVLLNDRIKGKGSDLKVLVVVTGKGPQKSMYERKMSQLKLEHVAVQTLWLEPADYPKLLSCADVGVSLHTSTSGLDLPMKILDLFGCRVPVCAINFECLSELVEDDENGRTFEGSQELADQLWYMLRPLGDGEGRKRGMAPHGYGDLARYSQKLEDTPRWHPNWLEHALPLLERAAV